MAGRALSFLLIACVVLVFASRSNADFSQIQRQQKVEILEVPTADGVTLRGRHFSNPGGIKFLLIHGFAETWYIFRYLAPAMQALGYDVYAFNLRGHGNGVDRSIHEDVSPFSETPDRLYSFLRMVTYDIPAIRKIMGPGLVAALGHSKGGNVLRYYNTGLQQKGEGAVLLPPPPEMQLDLLFTLGTPVHFDFDLWTYKAWKQSPQFIADLLVQLAVSNADPRDDGKHIDFDILGLRSFCLEFAHVCLGPLFYRGLVSSQNLSTSARDHVHIFGQAATRPPSDFVKDIRTWGREGFSTLGLQLDGLPYPNPERFIQIVGTDDALSTYEDALREAKKRRQKNALWRMISHAHMDMAYGKKSADWLARRLDRTIRKQFGVQRQQQPLLSSCSNLLGSSIVQHP